MYFSRNTQQQKPEPHMYLLIHGLIRNQGLHNHITPTSLVTTQFVNTGLQENVF